LDIGSCQGKKKKESKEGLRRKKEKRSRERGREGRKEGISKTKEFARSKVIRGRGK